MKNVSVLFGIQAPTAAVFEMKRGRFGCCKIQACQPLAFCSPDKESWMQHQGAVWISALIVITIIFSSSLFKEHFLCTHRLNQATLDYNYSLGLISVISVQSWCKLKIYKLL